MTDNEKKVIGPKVENLRFCVKNAEKRMHEQSEMEKCRKIAVEEKNAFINPSAGQKRNV